MIFACCMNKCVHIPEQVNTTWSLGPYCTAAGRPRAGLYAPNITATHNCPQPSRLLRVVVTRRVAKMWTDRLLYLGVLLMAWLRHQNAEVAITTEDCTNSTRYESLKCNKAEIFEAIATGYDRVITSTPMNKNWLIYFTQSTLPIWQYKFTLQHKSCIIYSLFIWKIWLEVGIAFSISKSYWSCMDCEYFSTWWCRNREMQMSV